MNQGFRITALLLAAMTTAAAPAWGQGPRPSKPSRTTSPATPSAPAAPAQPVVTEEPKVGPYLKREGVKDWNLTYVVTLHSDRASDSVEHKDPNSGKSARMPKVTPFEFETAGVVFPYIPSTASSDAEEFKAGQTGPNATGFRGTLRVNDQIVDRDPAMLMGYPGGTALGRWDAGERGKTLSAREVQLEVMVPVSAYKVTYDETAALKLPWPQSWPKVAQEALLPQLFVEQGVDANGAVAAYDVGPLDKALELWREEWKLKDLKGVNPAALAKMMTSKVWEIVQPDGDGLTFRPNTGELAGIALRAPASTLVDAKGSEHDVVVLLVALMRKAGIPTRLVIGYDAGDSSGRWLDRSGKSSKLRTWAEFCLFDEKANTINWVPIDIIKLRKSSNRPAAMTKQWKYFGTNDQLDHILPFSFHFHPPTDVVSYGSPGFWGWFVSPSAPKHAEQAIRVSAAAQSKRGGDDADKKKKPKRN
ncbi:MAG: transglutaminase-like domain-containing protein [Phycisphaerales bacterium]